MEFQKLTSVKARTRRSTPVVIRSSTWAFTFSTPASANTTGVVSEGVAARLASSSTVTLLTGANVSTTRHAKMRREKLLRGMEIGAGSVEQADDGGVDVPHLVGSRRAQPDLRFHWMDAEPGPAPAVLSDEAVPGGGRGPDGAESLGKNGERAGRDVPIVGRGDHVLDRPDLGGVSRDGDV